jgi:hypothetical protein
MEQWLTWNLPLLGGRFRPRIDRGMGRTLPMRGGVRTVSVVVVVVVVVARLVVFLYLCAV